MSFITIEQVDEILGDGWEGNGDKKNAVLQANTWLETKSFKQSCLDPLSNKIITAAAYLAQLAAKGELYPSTNQGVLSGLKAKADTVEIDLKYAAGMEQAINGQLTFIESMIAPCIAVSFSLNRRTCR